MEDEINIRPYIKAIGRYFIPILIIALVSGVAAFALSSLAAPSYTATSLVAIIDDSLLLQFDPRFETVQDTLPIKALPEIAMSDEVLARTLSELPAELDISGIPQLRDVIGAEIGRESALLTLRANHTNPDSSAQIVNIWADTFVNATNDIYKRNSEVQLVLFEDQVEESARALSLIGQELVEFEGLNFESTLTAQLKALSLLQTDYLMQQYRFTEIIQDIDALVFQMSKLPRQTGVGFANQLSALALQLEAFNTNSSSSSQALPIDLQLAASEVFTTPSKDEQIQELESLKNVLETRLQEIEIRLSEIEPQILAVQQERQLGIVEASRLNRDYSLAEETYLAVSRKLEEERIKAGDPTESGLKVASRATPPNNPVNSNKQLVAVSVVVAAFFFLILVVIILQWWRSDT